MSWSSAIEGKPIPLIPPDAVMTAKTALDVLTQIAPLLRDAADAVPALWAVLAQADQADQTVAAATGRKAALDAAITEAEGRIGVLSHEEDRLRQVSTAADAAEKRRVTIEAQITRLREMLR